MPIALLYEVHGVAVSKIDFFQLQQDIVIHQPHIVVNGLVEYGVEEFLAGWVAVIRQLVNAVIQNEDQQFVNHPDLLRLIQLGHEIAPMHSHPLLWHPLLRASWLLHDALRLFVIR